MSRSPFPFLLTMMAVCAMSAPVWAKPNSSDSIKATIELNSTVNIGNKKLAPGEYRVIAQGDQAKFEQNGKVMAEAPCKLKELSSKPQQTDFVLDRGRLIEIQVSGKTEAIEFGS